MLRQYKRLLFILGVVIFYNLLHTTAFAQGAGVSPKKDSICRDMAMPIDLYNVLGIQISAANGYWVNEQGKVVDNIFNPYGLPADTYKFTYIVTTETYCNTLVGQEFPVEIKIREALLNVYLAEHIHPVCDLDNGYIIIDSIHNGTGSYNYKLVQDDGSGNLTDVSGWTTMNSMPDTVTGIAAGKYYLYIQDRQSNIMCNPVYVSHALEFEMGENTIDLKEDNSYVIINPKPTIDGKYAVIADGGTGSISYTWYEEITGPNGEKYDESSPIHDKRDYEGIKYQKAYWVVATDERGCKKEMRVKLDDLDGSIQEYYYFCQGDFTEMYSGILLEPRTVQNLIFNITLKPNTENGGWSGHRVDVYSDATSTVPETSDNWLVDAIKNGNSDTITKYIEVVRTSDNAIVVSRMAIKVIVKEKPSDLGLRILNDKPEWDIDEKVMFETSPANKDMYVYFLNNRWLDSVPLDNIKEVGAIDFTGTVRDMMRVHVLDSIKMTVPIYVGDSKGDVCTWVIDESVLVNIPFPNTFTPNGDGVNDEFLGDYKFSGREFHLEIVNRYGNRLYYGDKGWDGTYKGKQVAPGTYFYIVTIKLSDGTTRTLKGAVTLIRENR